MARTAKGKVEFKADGSVVSTFTLSDGRSFTYSRKLSLPDIYDVTPCTADAVLTYKAPSQGGDYSWSSERKSDVLQVIVNANGGNTIVIDVPLSNLVKRGVPQVTFYDETVVPQGSFSLQPLSS